VHDTMLLGLEERQEPSGKGFSGAKKTQVKEKKAIRLPTTLPVKKAER